MKKDAACRRSPVPFSSLLLPNFVKEIFTLHSLAYSKYSRLPLILHLLWTQSKVSSTAQLSCSNKIPLWLRKPNTITAGMQHLSIWLPHITYRLMAWRGRLGLKSKLPSVERLWSPTIRILWWIFLIAKEGLLEMQQVKSLITQGHTLTFALVKGQWQDWIKSDNKSGAVCRWESHLRYKTLGAH